MYGILFAHHQYASGNVNSYGRIQGKGCLGCQHGNAMRVGPAIRWSGKTASRVQRSRLGRFGNAVQSVWESGTSIQRKHVRNLPYPSRCDVSIDRKNRCQWVEHASIVPIFKGQTKHLAWAKNQVEFYQIFNRSKRETNQALWTDHET